jgi:hypothetical protein
LAEQRSACSDLERAGWQSGQLLLHAASTTIHITAPYNRTITIATRYNSGYYNPGYYTPQYDYSYSPDYYSGYPLNSYSYDPYGYADDFPLGYFAGSYGGTDYLSQMYADLLANGYEQGYLDGLYASENRNVGYYDPYTYENTVYDPYSYTLGENRRCLSEGYQIGYQDALNGNDEYDPYYSDTNTDLVSLLISNVLQLT